MKHFFFWVEAATWWIAWWTATLDPTKVLINGYAIDSSSINTGSITSTPTEGRGYCTSSGTLFDGCLKVDKLTQVTSDYTYLFMSFSKTFQATADRAGDYNAEPFDINAVEFPSEFNDVPFVKELASRKAENAAQKLTTETDGQGQVSAINKRIQYGILVFTIDKYYSSIDETNESFTKDALDLLNKSKWTTFITICGPSYIRSVNRKSGMVSLFSVLIDSDNASQEQMDAIKNSIQGVSPVAGENDDKGLNLATSSSLSIDLTSFGLSMRGEQNNVILSAKTLKDFSTAASNAFLLMKNPKSGVVTGIEVIPWSNNINFQLLSRLDVNLEETLCYNGPQEVSCTDSGVTVRRIRKISPVLKQFNFMSNAEHIASIESIHSDMRAKSELMHQCVIALRKVSPSSKLQHNWVENKKNPQSFSQLEAETGLVVVGESDEIEEADYNMVDAQRLLLLLEGDLCRGQVSGCVCAAGEVPGVSCITHSARRYQFIRKELDTNKYFLNFVIPCYSKLKETDLELEEGTMYTKHYSNIQECNNPICLVAGSYWDDSDPDPTNHGCALLPQHADENYDPNHSNDVDFLVSSYCEPTYRLKRDSDTEFNI